ncbi:hypothetical protein ACJIZ3_008967 [Penstemon smallii]|uniref:RNase H type-1 domain-containing protein n=1 Tax=Penstemon smallii TaxID=265156 RepID=A0ABD3TB77_9LAMI
MSSGHENSKNQNDNGISEAAVAATAVAGMAGLAVWGLSKLFGLVVWGLSKLFGSSKPEDNNMTMASTVSRDGWFQLNTGASVILTFQASIYGSAGRWIVGFTARLEPCNMRSAELQAVREGMKLAWKRGLKKVIIETDSEQAVNHLIKNPNKLGKENISLRSIIEECRNLRKHDWNTELKLIDKEDKNTL